ncbi:TPA_exp: putative Cytochrome P450 monooxygenase [Trichophyton benhamiae CBS 112371]|nr:TPA_exp: putative Cytochrome P450 monooxygenase [Trichophyton benhamiae CBS 112371]
MNGPDSLNAILPGIAAVYGILRPEGIILSNPKLNSSMLPRADPITEIRFHNEHEQLDSIEELIQCNDAVGISINGHPVREPQQPPVISEFGNHFEIYPDHIGNHQRLFNKYGSVIRTDNFGRVTYLANDPDITAIAFREGEYFTKAPSTLNHPLYRIRDQTALFLCDTDAPAWKDAHRYIPPSMTPRAVRHYTPLLQRSVEASFRVLDIFDKHGEAFNVYQFTAKLASQIIC